MFSKTCEYAIRSLIFIARGSASGRRVGIREIADSIDAPEHFIAKILQDLVKNGLVQSMKGPGGGFYLDEASLNGSLADIVRLVDGDKLFSGCGLGLKECSETHPCPIHHEFMNIRREIGNMLEQTRLNDFAGASEAATTFLRRRTLSKPSSK